MSLNPLRASRTRSAPALVFIHPVLGDSEVYRTLAERLEWAGPVLGIDAPGLHADEPLPTSLADFAARYHAELADETSPRYLAGWAVGGVIAAELSQRMREAGEEVRFLGLLDSRAPIPAMRDRPTDRDSLARGFVATSARVAGREPPAPPASGAADEVMSALRAAGVLPPGWDEATIRRRCDVFASVVTSFFHHPQRALATPVHLFEAEEVHPDHPRPDSLGWEDHAQVERAPIGGTHFTLLAPQHIDRLARTLDAALARIAP